MNLRRLLIVVHRYLGIPLSFVFVVWFLSGIVMMYSGGMPRLTPELRLQRLAPIDLSAVRIGAYEASQILDSGFIPSSTTLLTVLGRPAYRFRGDFGSMSTVFADTGEVLDWASVEQAQASAAQFASTDEQSLHFVQMVEEPDQWTITESQNLPFYEFEADDASDTHLYVSPPRAEVALITTRGSRLLAWLGAIPHWFYFTPLRSDQPLWYWTVVWTAVVGCVLAVLGLILGVTQFRRTKPFRLSASIPYRGWMRWHYILGAVFGILSLTWAFSGMMSMEPFDWTRENGLEIRGDVFSGGDVELPAYPALEAREWQPLLGDGVLKEVEYLRIQGAPYLLARTTLAGDASSSARERLHQPYPLSADGPRGEILVDARTMQPRTTLFDTASIVRRLEAKAGGVPIEAAELLDDYDSYYYARNGLAPLPVLRVKFGDPLETWYYVDPAKSEIVGRVHKYSRIERWLFNGLHDLDFAFWYDKRPLWDIAMILLSLGALTASAIGLWLGLKRLRRDFTNAKARRLRAAEPAR